MGGGNTEISLFGPALDVAIGLALIYLVFSMLLSTIVESAAAVLKLRARALENTILRLIADPSRQKNIVHYFLGIFGAEKAAQKTAKAAAGPAATLVPGAVPSYNPVHLADLVYEHPLVAGTAGKERPSYLHAANFSAALLAVLRGLQTGALFSDVERAVAALPPSSVRTALVTCIQESQGDWSRLRRNVEGWYNGAMDRLSGDYKRFIQLVTFTLGLILAAAMNVNSIDLAQRMWVEKDLRQIVVGRAAVEVDRNPDSVYAQALRDRTVDRLAADIDNRVALAHAELRGVAPWSGPRPAGADQYPAAITGWVLTAFAAMLGAPFWFELLQKLVNLRSAGPKPEAEEPPRT